MCLSSSSYPWTFSTVAVCPPWRKPPTAPVHSLTPRPMCSRRHPPPGSQRPPLQLVCGTPPLRIVPPLAAFLALGWEFFCSHPVSLWPEAKSQCLCCISVSVPLASHWGLLLRSPRCEATWRKILHISGIPPVYQWSWICYTPAECVLFTKFTRCFVLSCCCRLPGAAPLALFSCEQTCVPLGRCGVPLGSREEASEAAALSPRTQRRQEPLRSGQPQCRALVRGSDMAPRSLTSVDVAPELTWQLFTVCHAC